MYTDVSSIQQIYHPLFPYCDTSDETDTLSLETMLSSISNKS